MEGGSTSLAITTVRKVEQPDIIPIPLQRGDVGNGAEPGDARHEPNHLEHGR